MFDRVSMTMRVVIALLALSSFAARADVPSCQNVNLTPQVRIAACDKVIADAKQTDDARAEAYYSRGSVLDEDGQHDKAIADFDRSLKLVPNDPATLVARGNAHDSRGDKAKAIADYSEAIRINPGDAAPYYNRGAIHQELGDTAKAVADYERALKIDPEFDGPKQGLLELAGK